jgi:hypothetical protein
MAYRHLPSPDFHRLDCQHYGLREDEHEARMNIDNFFKFAINGLTNDA